MNTKKLLVSLSLAVLAIFLVATVSASGLVYDLNNNYNVSYSTGQLALDDESVIEIDGINVLDAPSLVGGDYVAVVVEFTAAINATDVEIEIELGDNKVVSKSFDVEADHTYRKALKIEVPTDDLDDEISDEVALEVTISGEDWDNDDVESSWKVSVNTQRESYNPEVKSITVAQSVEAGETFPVSIVLKNMGYNDLEDTYVTVAISELGVYKTRYFGDLVNLEDVCDSDDEDCDDTVNGVFYLTVPYGVEAGVYTLEVVVENDDVEYSVAKQLVIENDFASNVIVTTSGKTVSVGDKVEYTLLLVNPTNDLRVYTLVVESAGEVSTSTETVVPVSAGSSKTVTLTAEASEAGQYNIVVNVLSGSDAEKVELNLNVEEKSIANPVIVLTVILAIIFLVLLVVLIVLLGRKPAKTEEFGESYY